MPITPRPQRDMEQLFEDLLRRVRNVENAPNAAYNPATGDLLHIGQLAFGPDGVADAATITPTINTWTTGSLSLPVTVSTGRLIVFIGGRVVAGSGGTGGVAQASLSYAISGPTTVAEDRGRGVHCEFDGTGMQTIDQASFGYVHTGLTPGAYTIVDRMIADSTGSPSNQSSFSNRSLVAFPF